MRNGWTETTLGEVAEVLDRYRRPVSAAEREKRLGDVPYYGATGVAGWIDEALFDEDLVLLGEDAIDFLNPQAAKAYQISGPSWVNNHAHVLRSRPEVALTTFLSESLNLVDYSQFTSYGTRSKLTQRSMMTITIALPPLVEQRRIVDVIESVDTYINTLETRASTARIARSALLHELLSAGGEDWTETTLGEVATASWGNTSVTKKSYQETGYTAFSASGPDGFVDWFEHDEPGVVLSAIGALCGKTWLAADKWTPIKNTIWFRSKSNDCLSEFLFVATQIPDVWPIRGQAQPFISLGDVRGITIALPPLVEQRRIVDVIESVDGAVAAADAAAADARDLRSALLSDLLSGDHEIPESYDRFLGAA